MSDRCAGDYDLIIGRAAFKILKENGMLLADTALLPAARECARW